MNIILLTGTCGVGKTTVARQLAERLSGAVIHGDQIRLWIRSTELRRANDHQRSIVVRITINAIREFANLGLDVVLDNVWTPECISAIRSALGERWSMYPYWLMCSRAENRKRDLNREPSLIMGQRVDELFDELQQMPWPADLVKLDSTNMSAAETADKIYTDVFGTHTDVPPSTPGKAIGKMTNN